MKKHFYYCKSLMSLFLLNAGGLAIAFSQNNWQPKSFAASAARDLILMKEAFILNDEPSEDIPYYLGAIGEYSSSFGSKSCSNGFQGMPFWSGLTTMSIGTNNGKSDLDAYQFGLYNVVTPGAITINAQYKEFGTDFAWYFIQNKGERGFVGKINVPLSGTRTTVNLCETPAQLSNEVDANWNVYPAPAMRPQTLTSALNGGILSSNCNALTNTSYLSTIALYSGRFSATPLTTVKVADLSFVFGYNVVYEERGFLMLGLKVACPTGNVATGNFVYQPIVGRGGNWGLGLETSAAIDLYKNDCYELRLWAQGEALHLFNGRTGFRSFDLKQNGPGSKYLLLQYYYASNPNTTTATPPNPSGFVPMQITQAVNITTMPVISTYDIEGSLAIMIDGKKENWNLGVGLEVWGRTKEKLSVDLGKVLNMQYPSLNSYAVLGRQTGSNTSSSLSQPYQQALCEPLAKINESLEVVNLTTSSSDYDTTRIKDARDPNNRIPANVTEALDICGAAQHAAITGKLFGEIGYTWKELCHTPNISIFASVEGASANSNLSNMWTAGIKASFNF